MNKPDYHWLLLFLFCLALSCKGDDGPQGPEGPQSLVTATRFESNGDCAAGGIRLEVGTDDNRDGVLDGGEIESTSFLCNGSNGNAVLTDVTTVTSGDDCANGGYRLAIGFDVNGNDVLEESEIDNVSFICNGESFEAPQGVLQLVDWGDSLTAGTGGGGTTMSNVTAGLLGPSWEVINMGVGGESSITIGARQGGMPMYIAESITIPADGSSVELPVTTDDNGNEVALGLFSLYNDEAVYPLRQQGDRGVNPVSIQGIECELTRNGGTNRYSIQRLEAGDREIVTNERELIITSGAALTDGVATFFVGQNGGYDGSGQDFLNQIKKLVQHKGDGNFLIITSHGNGFENVIEPVIQEYGLKVIDLKTYMRTVAIRDAIAFGLLPDDGSVPTEQDREDMRNSKAPASLRDDDIHLNAIGYQLVGRLRYQRGQELGYW